MKEQLLEQLRQSATRSAIEWAKTDKDYFSMRESMEQYIEATGVNKSCGNAQEAIRLGRQAVTKAISVDVIMSLDKSQLHKLDNELSAIANTIPNQENKGYNR